MSQVQCWECGEEFSKLEVFDIPVFGHFTVQWCFKCANKQLEGTDYQIINKLKIFHSQKRKKKIAFLGRYRPKRRKFHSQKRKKKIAFLGRYRPKRRKNV